MKSLEEVADDFSRLDPRLGDSIKVFEKEAEVGDSYSSRFEGRQEFTLLIFRLAPHRPDRPWFGVCERTGSVVQKKSFLVMSPHQRFLLDGLDRVRKTIRRLPSSPEAIAEVIAGIDRFERDGKIGELIDINGMTIVRLVLAEDL